jgi:hypothetical protein
MAHLGLSLAPIGQGAFRNAPRPRNNNHSNNESVYEIDTDLLTPPPVGNNYESGGLNWARNRRQEFITPRANNRSMKNAPNRPRKGPKPPSTPTRKVFRNLNRKAPDAPKKNKKKMKTARLRRA